MTKEPIFLPIADLAGFSRALARQLGAGGPSHLTLMNMLARAAGYANLQHLRASGVATPAPEIAADPPDARLVARVLAQFDAAGRLMQWPAKRSVQTPALWALWACLPAGKVMSEAEISALLDGEHLFGDAAILRRTLVACGLVARGAGAVDYCRVETPPPAIARAVMRAVAQRRKGRSTAQH